MKSRCSTACAMPGMSSASLKLPTLTSMAALALSAVASWIRSTSSWFGRVMMRYERSSTSARSRSSIRGRATLRPSDSAMLTGWVSRVERVARSLVGDLQAAGLGCGGVALYARRRGRAVADVASRGVGVKRAVTEYLADGEDQCAGPWRMAARRRGRVAILERSVRVKAGIHSGTRRKRKGVTKATKHARARRFDGL